MQSVIESGEQPTFIDSRHDPFFMFLSTLSRSRRMDRLLSSGPSSDYIFVAGTTHQHFWSWRPLTASLEQYLHALASSAIAPVSCGRSSSFWKTGRSRESRHINKRHQNLGYTNFQPGGAVSSVIIPAKRDVHLRGSPVGVRVATVKSLKGKLEQGGCVDGRNPIDSKERTDHFTGRISLSSLIQLTYLRHA